LDLALGPFSLSRISHDLDPVPLWPYHQRPAMKIPIALFRGALLALLCFAGAVFPLRAALVWRPGEGWADESTGAGLSASSSRDQLDIVHKLEAQGDYDGALQACRILVRKWPFSFFAPEAQFKIGLYLERRGEFWEANKAFDKMIEKYPASSFFDEALEHKFKIGNLYLSGEPKRLWRIPVGSAMDRAVQIFESILKAAPFGRLASEAQFRLGLAKEKQKKFAEAVGEYNKVLERYPNSPVASEAQYQIGYAWLQASREPDYDQTAAQKAIEAFQDFLVRYPNSEKVEAAKAHVAALQAKQTAGSFQIARFYEEQRNLKAAYIYYSDVVRQSPDSEEGKIAKRKVEELKPRVEKDLGLPPEPQPKTAETGKQASAQRSEPDALP
jgi:outer membrane protein assembly factor BamD